MCQIGFEHMHCFHHTGVICLRIMGSGWETVIYALVLQWKYIQGYNYNILQSFCKPPSWVSTVLTSNLRRWAVWSFLLAAKPSLLDSGLRDPCNPVAFLCG